MQRYTEISCKIVLTLTLEEIQELRKKRDYTMLKAAEQKDAYLADIAMFLDEVTPRLDSDIPTPEEIEEDAKYYAEHPEEL